jgi:hypothetical protein
MIDTTKPVTVQRSGGDVMSQGDSPLQLFSFGKILLVRDDHVIVLVSSTGKKERLERTFPQQWNGVTLHYDMPEGHDLPPAQTAEEAGENAAEPPKKRGRQMEGETKMQKCRRIFAEMNGKPKADIVARFISDAGCTAGGANTYYCTLVKE